MSDDGLISSRHLSYSLTGSGNDQQPLRPGGIMPLREATEILERELVGRAVLKYGSTRRVAKVLGVTHTTVQRKIRQYGLVGSPVETDTTD